MKPVDAREFCIILISSFSIVIAGMHACSYSISMTVEQLITDYGAYIFNYAWKLACSPDEAEDLSQETFIHAWKRLDTLRDGKAVKGWLRRICFNCFLMKHRTKDGRSLQFTADESLLEGDADWQAAKKSLPQPEEEVLVEESVREMQNGCFYAMVRRLTLAQRTAFSLVDMFGLTVQETAELLAVSEGSLKAQLFRARMNLDAFFSDHCSVISVANPCSCRAWQEFWASRAQNQQQMRQSAGLSVADGLADWHKKDYHFDPSVRAKIRYLYAHMPDKEPDRKWFEKVIQAVSLQQLHASSLVKE